MILSTLTRPALICLAGAGSALLLAAAFAFQYLAGLHPCVLCLWQRWPHAAAVIIALAALRLKPAQNCSQKILCALGLIAALTTAGIGFFHVGVEQGWWQGLQSCTGGSLAGISASDLLNPNANIAPPTRCDAIAWQRVGISMAGWNVIASLVLAAIWAAAARKD